MRQVHILYADIELSAIGIAKAAYDPVGHYSRPDVLRLLFNPAPLSQVQPFEEMPAASLAEGVVNKAEILPVSESVSEA